MRRWVAVLWHATFAAVAAVLYFFFVLPRWYELMGQTSHTLGTVLRIVTGALIGLAALPVVFTLLRTRRPEFGTPALALRLRVSSIVLHVLAGVLIIGAAVSEIWLDLDAAGQWLFGAYGAAAAVALLGVFAFYLAFVAELPPPPPKPLKTKAEKRRRGRRKAAAGATDAAEAATGDEAAGESPAAAADDAEADDDTATESPTEVTAGTPAEPSTDDDAADPQDETEPDGTGKLRNRRPAGKATLTRRRRRSRGGVAVED
jgi:hypothetical protein